MHREGNLQAQIGGRVSKMPRSSPILLFGVSFTFINDRLTLGLGDYRLFRHMNQTKWLPFPCVQRRGFYKTLKHIWTEGLTIKCAGAIEIEDLYSLTVLGNNPFGYFGNYNVTRAPGRVD